MHNNRKIIFIIAALLILLTLASLISVFFIIPGSLMEQDPVAEIYQDGVLIQSIPLNQVTDSYTIEISAANDGHNIIEVRFGEIGIISADCPDQICVRQGFIQNSVLPITCLPHRLVIQIRSADTYDN